MSGTPNGPGPRHRRVTEGGSVRYHGPEDPSCVYRIYNSSNEVIYVGMSYEPDTRVRVQRREKSWGHEIARYEAEWHPNRDAAKQAEEQLIKELWPCHNVVHTPEHRLRSVLHMPSYVHDRARARIQADLQSHAQQIAEGRTTGKRADPANPDGP